MSKEFEKYITDNKYKSEDVMKFLSESYKVEEADESEEDTEDEEESEDNKEDDKEESDISQDDINKYIKDKIIAKRKKEAELDTTDISNIGKLIDQKVANAIKKSRRVAPAKRGSANDGDGTKSKKPPAELTLNKYHVDMAQKKVGGDK